MTYRIHLPLLPEIYPCQVLHFPEYNQNNSFIAAFGPTTAKAVKEAGLKLTIPAPTKSAPPMTMAIEEYLTQLAKENRKNGRK